MYIYLVEYGNSLLAFNDESKVLEYLKHMPLTEPFFLGKDKKDYLKDTLSLPNESKVAMLSRNDFLVTYVFKKQCDLVSDKVYVVNFNEGYRVFNEALPALKYVRFLPLANPCFHFESKDKKDYLQDLSDLSLLQYLEKNKTLFCLEYSKQRVTPIAVKTVIGV